MVNGTCFLGSFGWPGKVGKLPALTLFLGTFPFLRKLLLIPPKVVPHIPASVEGGRLAFFFGPFNFPGWWVFPSALIGNS